MMIDRSVLMTTRPHQGTVGDLECPSKLAMKRFASTQRKDVCFENAPEAGPQRRRDLQACVARLLESSSSLQCPVEKRAQRRYTFRRPLVVTPVDNNSGRPDHLRNFAAFGIDISPTGICFLARQLVPARRAVVSCGGPGGEKVNLLFEPRWVRFTRGSWYQTGGRLLAVLEQEADPVPTPPLIETPPDIDLLCGNSR